MPTSKALTHNRTGAALTPVPTVRTIAAIAAAALLVVGQLYATLPLLGELGRDFNVAPTTVAWTSSVFGFAYAAGMLVAGPLSDRFGRRRIAVAGLVAAAAATAAVSLAPTFSALLAFRVLQGAAAAFFPPVALAYLTERIDPRHRSTALTIVISAFLAAAIVAPLASRGLAAIAGWQTWFDASALALGLLAALLWRILRPDAARPQATSVGAQLVRLPGLLRVPRLSGLFLTTITVMWAYVGVTTVVQLIGPGTGGNPAAMQAVRIWTLPVCVLVPLLAPVLARVPRRGRLIGALAVLTVAIAGVAFASGPDTLAVALAAMTVGVAVAAPALVETVGHVSPVSSRGSATALYGFTLFVGASLAAPTAAAGQALGFTLATCVFAAVVAIGSISSIAATR